MAGFDIYTNSTGVCTGIENIHTKHTSLLIAIYWIWNLFNINTGYVTEIIKSIENRQLNLDEVKFDFQEANTLNTLEEALDSGNEFEQILH